MLQELEFSVCSLAEDGRAEGFHDLLYRHGRSSKLIFGGAAEQG